MVAQLASSTVSSTSQNLTTAQDELAKLRQQCLRLNQALEAERAKTSKLRNFIGRLNSARAQPTAPTAAAPAPAGLEALVTDQNRLIEQLYAENQKNQAALTEMATRNQQLLTANDKLKARNIDLRRQLKTPVNEPQTGQTTGHAEAVPGGIRTMAQSIKENIEHKLSETAAKHSQKKRAHQWLRVALNQKQHEKVAAPVDTNTRWFLQQI